MLQTRRPGISAKDVYKACCSTISDTGRRDRLLNNATVVDVASHDYANAGLAGALSSLSCAAYPLLDGATDVDMQWLYNVRLVDSAPGRPYYKMLRDGNGERCALCNVVAATTLDHHLPKSDFAVFAITPDNLLPACAHCNHAKLNDTTPTLNTYFDDLGPAQWLKTRLVERSPFLPDFFIDPQPEWSADLRLRAQSHFEILGLRKLYSKQGIRFISGIRGVLTKMHEQGGAAAVRDYVEPLARSYVDSLPNGWESALLLAAAESDWFCDGGFKV